MKIIAFATEKQREELLSQVTGEQPAITWIDAAEQFAAHSDADAFIQLASENFDSLIHEPAKLVIINTVNSQGKALPANVVVINGWPTFLKRNIVEATAGSESIKTKAENIFALFNKKMAWMQPGEDFISLRVVAMIINEAYLALEEGVSSKEEIDIAMKTGTNYPFGPFEWAEKIGVQKIHAFLENRSRTEKRYKPATLLTQEALG